MFPAGKNIAKLNIDDIVEGKNFSFEEVITEKMVDKFAELSGDYNGLHMVEEFARKRDFNGRVVHGVLLTSLLSRLVGMHLPGENAFLLSMNTQFAALAYLGGRIISYHRGIKYYDKDYMEYDLHKNVQRLLDDQKVIESI